MRHLFSSSSQSQSPLSSLTSCIPPLLPPSSSPPHSSSVWVTPGWVSLWSWDGFFLLTRASPDNAVQPDTNIIKYEELLVRVPANADMKWKVGERRDVCLTVQRERLKNSQWGPVRRAHSPVLCGRKPNRCFLLSSHPPPPLLFLFVLSSLLSIFLTAMCKTHTMLPSTSRPLL